MRRDRPKWLDQPGPVEELRPGHGQHRLDLIKDRLGSLLRLGALARQLIQPGQGVGLGLEGFWTTCASVPRWGVGAQRPVSHGGDLRLPGRRQYIFEQETEANWP